MKKVFYLLLLNWKKFKSPSLSLQEFAEIVEREFLREYKKETKVVLSHVNLVILQDDGGSSPALCYFFDSFYWVVRYDKSCQRISMRYANEHFVKVYYQSKLQDGQLISYSEKKDIFYQQCEFYHMH